jgi:phospholipase/carboxylesterase
MPSDLPLPIEWLPLSGRTEQLILLLHGWCDEAMNMAPLAQALRLEFPQAAVLAPEAPNLGDKGRGSQWYSIDGLNESTWPARVATVLPMLAEWVTAQQQRLGVGPAATALGGFSQGAVLALTLALRHDGIAGRVLAFGGLLPEAPETAPQHTTLHFFHGGRDKVFPASALRMRFEQLGALQADATIDIAEEIGHELHPVLIDCALHRLKGCAQCGAGQQLLTFHIRCSFSSRLQRLWTTRPVCRPACCATPASPSSSTARSS